MVDSDDVKCIIIIPVIIISRPTVFDYEAVM